MSHEFDDTIIQLLEAMHQEARKGGGWDPVVVDPSPFDNLKHQYQEAARQAASAEEWARYQTAFAESLPQLTQSIINARDAFRNGDTFGGTAAIMDMCGTMSTF